MTVNTMVGELFGQVVFSHFGWWILGIFGTLGKMSLLAIYFMKSMKPKGGFEQLMHKLLPHGNCCAES